MKYMLDFPKGYNYGFPREYKPADWQWLQEDRTAFFDLLAHYRVPENQHMNAWLWARWYKDDNVQNTSK